MLLAGPGVSHHGHPRFMNESSPQSPSHPAQEAAGAPGHASWVLRFEALLQQGRSLAFPCDERGRVELDMLTERARCDYFYARAFVGRAYEAPTIVPCPLNVHTPFA